MVKKRYLSVRVEVTEHAERNIRPAAEAILGLFTDLTQTPTESNAESAAELSVEAGAFIATFLILC
jgi:hypothetical protein